MSKRPALLPLLFCVFLTANAQGPTTLQLGTPIERTLKSGQTQEFTLNLKENTFVQLVVEQRGIDAIVKVLSPNGKILGDFDSPNGNDGPEHVSFVASAAGAYVIAVSPLNPADASKGTIEIKILEMREANEQEIKAGKNKEMVKAKGIALLVEMDGLIGQIKSPLTRIKAQLQAAQLISSSDEKRASKYFADATIGFKEYLASLDPGTEKYPQQFQAITEMRLQIIQILTERDPDAALSFIYSSKPPPNPFEDRRFNSQQESMLELSIANRLVRTDPNRALQIARQTLKTHFSVNLISTISLLKEKSPELAAQFASEIASKLLNDKLLSRPDAASVLLNLLRFDQNFMQRNPDPNANTQRLLSDEQYRELLQKAVTEAMSFSRPPAGTYSPERDAALTLLYGLQQLGPEVNSLADGGEAALRKKLQEINPDGSNGMEYQNLIGNNSFDAALEGIEKVPKDQREQLYLQLANREASNGDTARARQIVNDRVTNPYQRRQALANIDQQEMFRAVSKGKAEDALRMLGNLKNPRERARRLVQIVEQIGPGQKRGVAINLLEQARSLLGSSMQAQDQDQMNALLEIARSFGKYDAKRSFEILDPLIDQVNDLCAAARTMEGFGPENFDDDELSMQSGNTVAQVVMRMSNTIGSLALVNFERARATSDRLSLPEVRLRVYMEIAQQTTQTK
ncbi:MAG TPA: PPC domain-containing protein [Pyrinomonadaceae bacterium]|nr:PPC domain-containing protein [Pyrinomonadaceae bacterium]